MKCEKCRELRLAAERTAAEQAEMEQHLAECAACREEAAEEDAIWQALRSLPEEDLPEGYHAELMQKLQAEQKVVPFAAKKKQAKWKQMSLIAAAVLLVVAAGGMNGILELRKNNMTAVAQMEMATDTTAPEETETPETAQMEEATGRAAAEPKKNESEQVSVTAEPMQDGAESSPQTASMADGIQPLAGGRGAVRIQAGERLSLEVAELTQARAIILEELTALDGYEEETDAAALLYAVVPIENAARFLEKLEEIGSLERLESVPAQEQDAFRVIEIQLCTKP